MTVSRRAEGQITTHIAPRKEKPRVRLYRALKERWILRVPSGRHVSTFCLMHIWLAATPWCVFFFGWRIWCGLCLVYLSVGQAINHLPHYQLLSLLLSAEEHYFNMLWNIRSLDLKDIDAICWSYIYLLGFLFGLMILFRYFGRLPNGTFDEPFKASCQETSLLVP